MVILFIIKCSYIYIDSPTISISTPTVIDISLYHAWSTEDMVGIPNIEPSSHFSDWGSSSGDTGSSNSNPATSEPHGSSTTNKSHSSTVTGSESTGNPDNNSSSGSSMPTSNTYPNGFSDSKETNFVRTKPDTIDGTNVVTKLSNSNSLNNIKK